MVRTRFAPSPTGFLHVGGLRTALYNYLFARKNKGQFILRVEDTDQERFVEGATDDIIKSLKTCGLDYDEGPVKGGKHGPYFQSERLPIYQKNADKLVSEGKAYPCFCSAERLDGMRQQQLASKLPPKYDRHCLSLPKEEVGKLLSDGAKHVIRFKIPDQGQVIYKDLVKGEVKFTNILQEDFVMIKSDGFPTYHLANIVDDHLMEITHVIRGDEWLSSLPKHLLLYEAFGWKHPEFAHIPLLLNKDRAKLSKRHGDVSVKDYFEKGYLPDALLNFVVMLGWNPGNDQEVYDLAGLVKAFDISGINKSGAVFDLEKLDWMNGYYIRHATLEKLSELSMPYLVKANLISENGGKIMSADGGEEIKPAFLMAVLKLEQERLKKLSELADATGFYFHQKLDYPADLLNWKNTDAPKTRLALKTLEVALADVESANFKAADLHDLGKKLAEEKGFKNGEIFWPWRVALSGKNASPSPQDISEVLGQQKTIQRIKDAISRLG